jgi:hypothetical protein
MHHAAVLVSRDVMNSRRTEMDRSRFDALTRLFATERSRRSALGAMIGALALGTGDAVAKQKKNKKAKTCFGTKHCGNPRDGKSFRDCDFFNIDFTRSCNGCDFRGADLTDADFNDFPNASFQGASFREANLRGADAAYADFSGSSFRDACLAGTDFFHANLDGASLRGAILCNTVMPNGSIDNSGCDKATECCPPCLAVGDACGDGIFGDCCDTQCVNGFCAIECVKDTDCDAGEFCCGNTCGEECCLDSQCPSGICDDGQCTCIKDTDCPPSDRCVDNHCVPE